MIFYFSIDKILKERRQKKISFWKIEIAQINNDVVDEWMNALR